MLSLIENLLVLQDRDRKLIRLKSEIAKVDPERRALSSKLNSSQNALEAAKTRGKQIESDRKRLELEVEAKQQLIAKYSVQQFQTKKNEEYRALANEIINCKKEITHLEDQQLELMSSAEAAAKEVAEALKVANGLKADVEKMIAELGVREQTLMKQLSELETGRPGLAAAIDESALSRYERLLKNKGENVIVDVEHGVCGGCHMKLPTQILVSLKGQPELVCCPNCGRILYYTRDMDMTIKD